MTLLSDTEQQLQKNVDAQQPLFSHIDVGDIASCFTIVDGAPSLVISNAHISSSGSSSGSSDQIDIAGQTTLPAIGTLTIQATCTEVDGDIAVSLLTTLPGDGALTIPGLSAGIEDVACTFVTQPIVSPLITARTLSSSIAGTFILGSVQLPIMLDIPGDTSDWLLSNTASVSLPSLTDLAQLVGDPAILDTLPSELETLANLSLSHLSLSFNPVAGTISAVTLGIATDEPLEIVPSVLSIEQLMVLLYVQNPTDATNRAFGATFSSVIQLVGEEISVSADIPSLAVTGSIEPDPGLSLTALIQQLLPQGITLPSQVPDIILSDLTIRADPRAKAFSLYTRSYLEWQIVPNIFTIRSLAANLQRDNTGTQADIAGILEIAGVDVNLSAAIDQQMTLTGVIDEASLSQVVAHFFNGSPLPTEVPDVSLTNVNVSLTPATGAFSLSGIAAAQWDFGTGGQSVNTQLTLDLKRVPSPDAHFECSVSLNASGPLQIAEGVELDNMQFAFSRSSSSDWTLSGTVNAVLFDTSLSLNAAYTQSATDKKLQLSTLLASPHDLITLSGIGGLNATSVSIELDRQTVSPPAKSLTTWNVSATGRFHADNVCDLPGTVQLYKKSNGSAGLNFIPDNAHASIPLTAFSANSRQAALNLQFGGITISRAASQPGAASSGWLFDASLQLSFVNLPTDITNVFPIPATTTATFSANSSSVKLTVDRLLAPVDFKIPDIEISSALTIPLGSARLDLTNLSIALGQTLQISATIGVGLPSELNNLFGTSDGKSTPKYTFFNTFDPSQPDATTIKVQLSADDKSISLLPQSSPIKAIQPTNINGKSWWVCDLGESGSFQIEVPGFSYNPSDSSFAASGAFVINQEPPLQIPLGSIKRMLGPLGNILHTGIPIREFNLLDAQGNLDIEAVLKLLPEGASVDVLKNVLTDIASAVDRLPDTFKEYLDITIPQNLSFNISSSPTGSLRFDVNTETNNPLKIMYPTIAILPPTPLPVPAVFGIQLSSLSFGPLCGGSLFQLQIDAIFDQFDLVTLGTSLLLPQDGSIPLPTSRELQRRFILEKLFMIIVYETVIPVPIPVFYQQLGMEYLGLEGVTVQAHASFPMPSANFKEASQLFSEIKQFFTDKTYFLPTDPSQAPQNMNMVFSLSKDYIQTPIYLSSKFIGIANDGPSINLYQTVAKVLNCLKKLSLGNLTFDEVLQLIPLANRVGQDQFSFGPLSFSSSWLVTTPAEFEQGAYKQLPTYSSQSQAPINDLNSVIHLPPSSGGQESGLITFLQGQANLENIASFSTRFGLAASSTQGFQVGLQLNGKVANLLDADLGGYVALHLPHSGATPATTPATTSFTVIESGPGPVVLPPLPQTIASYALSFDGKSSYLDVPTLNIQPEAFTVEWWLNPRSHHDYNQCIAASNGWGSFVFHTTGTGQVYVGTDVATRLTPNELGNSTVQLNTWQHFAFTFDHGTGCFYKNGTLLASKTGMTHSAPWGGFRIGQLPSETYYILSTLPGLPSIGQLSTIDGLVNEVRVWDHVVSALDIQARMYTRLSEQLPGLLACWACDESVDPVDAVAAIAPIIPDVTGQYTAQQVGTTWVSPGLVKLSGLLFDGQQSFVEVPSLTWQPATFTVEWWLNPRSHHNYNQCIDASNGWGTFVFHTTELGEVYIGTDVATRLTPNELGNGTVQLNIWQHFAFTFDHGTGCFYKNGILLASKTGMAASNPWGGFRISIPSGPIDGLVDEVRIWNRVLPAQEIQASLLNRLNGNEAGLQAYWQFNQGSGTIVQDSTHQNPATLIHTSWAEPPMVKLSGLLFDGQQSYVGVPSLTLQPTAFTVEWWLNPRSHHDYNQLIAASNGWVSFVFHTTETGAVYVGTDAATRLTPNELKDGTVQLNTWQHFAFTFDHGTANFYKNGSLLASKSGMSNPAPWKGFFLGQPNSGTIDGRVDEVRVWSRALSAEEIQAYQDRQRTGFEPGLYGYWRFTTSSGSTSTDLTSNAWQTDFYNVHAVLSQVPDTLSNTIFQLDGHCDLSLLNYRVFTGDIQITDTSFWTKGQLTLFPPQSPLQAGGNLQGWISKKEFYLAGDASVSLAGLVLDQAKAILSNNLIMLSGTCLGVTATLDVQPNLQELVVKGTIQPELKVNVDLGQILGLSNTVVAQNMHIDLDVAAQLVVTISGSAGFSATVDAWGYYNGKKLSTPTFTLTIVPTDLKSLADEIAQQFKQIANQLFNTIYTDAKTWIEGVASGAFQWASNAYQDTARVLKDVYHLSLDETVSLLNEAGKTVEEIGKTVYGIYTISATEVTNALQKINALVDQVGSMLKDVFNTSADQAAQVLKDAGYTADQVASTLTSIYNLSADQTAQALNAAGYTASQIASVLKNTFGWSADQVAGFFKNTLNLSGDTVNTALQGAGYAADQVKSAMQSVYDWFSNIPNWLNPLNW